MVPGPPFVFGALLVMCALLVAEFIPSSESATGLKATSRRQSGNIIFCESLSPVRSGPSPEPVQG